MHAVNWQDVVLSFVRKHCDVFGEGESQLGVLITFPHSGYSRHLRIWM